MANARLGRLRAEGQKTGRPLLGSHWLLDPARHGGQNGRVEIIGHRGAALREPENTLRGIRHGLSSGADGVEIDVRLSGDGRAIILHDPRVDRTTGGKGLARHFTLGQLRKLVAGKGERIPTLEEAAECVRAHRQSGSPARLLIEIKEAGALESVLRLIRDFQAAGWMELSGFNAAPLAAAKKRMPELACALAASSLLKNPLRCAAGLGLEAVHLKHTLLTPRIVEAAARRGLKLRLWTVNAPDEMLRARSLGVAGIFTDDPDGAVQALRPRA
jgi:glycerophosphoryl diester phosphodiesterase